MALCALGLTIWQTRVTRKHNRLSVKPYLNTERLIKHNPTILTVNLVNNGLGPATIDKFEFCLRDGSPLPDSGDVSLLHTMESYFPEHAAHIMTFYMRPNYAIVAGEKKVLLEMVFKCESPPSEDFIDAQLKKVRLIVKYKSIYKEVFEYDSIRDQK
ncbi:hypothetical protein QE250_16875 [Chromatiaceae bacterium AAb-1]|nr:hypothetical protein [Chromatiaceae bacterium AAb-1]